MRCVVHYAILLRYVSPGVHESPYRDDILSMAIATSAAAFVHRYKLTVGCQHPICKQTWLMQEELTPECLALFLLTSFKFFLSYFHFSFSFPLSRSMLHLGIEMDDTDVTFRPTSIESLSKVCTTKKDGYLPIYVVSTLLNLLLMDCRCTARLLPLSWAPPY